MNLATEKSMIVLARLRLKALRVSLAGRQADLNLAQNTYHQLTGLTSLRFVQNNGLSVETIKELVILDNLAVLSIKTVHPEILGKLSKEAEELSRYLDMPARTLLDLLFKKGERFHNEAAISVAYHRGLISDIQHEADAYARLNAREQKRDA
jgi:AICAR transformylase/IMP cyclohydrolase PurH